MCSESREEALNDAYLRASDADRSRHVCPAHGSERPRRDRRSRAHQSRGAGRARGAWLRRGAWLSGILVGLLLAPTGWLLISSAGHTYQADDAPDAPVVIVFGAQLAAGGEQPKPFLRGRLDIAAKLLRRGAVTAILVSGDAAGSSGDETAVMTRYLVGQGVPKQRIAADDHGLDSYDTCRPRRVRRTQSPAR